jgi:2-isopropylmalate synthase
MMKLCATVCSRLQCEIPPSQKKIQILHLMETLGINSLALGLPGAGPRAVGDAEALAREIVSHKMKIRANCAARTHQNDIRPIAEIVQRTGLKIEAATFIGSSPIRRFTENWTDDFLLKTTENAVKYAVSLELDVMYVTEDTTRCDPEMVKRLYTAAINCGARAIVICDTAGHATPMGAFALVQFVINEVVKPSGEKIRVDWHGHCDRGLAIANSMAALVAGAECVHATALGIGERVGNTQMDQMLLNLKLMGIPPWAEQDLTRLKEYCVAVSQATGVPIPANYPVVGEDAFRTATGVHAAAVIKAYKKNDIELANTVYSGVPSHCVRPGTGDRCRSHEREVKRVVLAGPARDSGFGRCGGKHLPARQGIGPHTQRGGNSGVCGAGASPLDRAGRTNSVTTP